MRIARRILRKILFWRPRYYGLDNLDQKLEKYLSYKSGFFVELGANDGVSQSNTLYYEKYRGWYGILVEPTLHKFLMCQKNRSPKTKVFCNACVSFDYSEKFVEIAYSNLMSTPLNLNTDIPDPLIHANQGTRHLSKGESVVIYGAKARTLNTILIDSKAPQKIDFLSLDVEGAELDVLKGIDHSAFRFNIMCIESRSFEKLRAYLESLDYEFKEKITVHDYIFADKRNP